MSTAVKPSPRLIPAWDRVLGSLTVLQNSNIPDKHDRYLLDIGIRNRIPSSAGRAVKTIETFMLTWLDRPGERHTLRKRLASTPELGDVKLMVGKPKPNGTVSVSLSTRKGFIVVSFTQDSFTF